MLTRDATDPRSFGSIQLRKEVSDLMWNGDADTLYDRWPCRCCCDEHTMRECPARLWYGCRGQGTD